MIDIRDASLFSRRNCHGLCLCVPRLVLSRMMGGIELCYRRRARLRRLWVI